MSHNGLHVHRCIERRRSRTVQPLLPRAIFFIPVNDCPLCLLAPIRERIPSGSYTITCACCGEFVLTDGASILMQELPERFRYALRQAAHDWTL